MLHKKAIVILSAGYGDGHMQVSKTLRDKFGQLGYDNVRMVDLFREAHPAMNAFSRFLYSQSPALSELGFDYYGWSYYWTRDMKSDGMMWKWLGTWGLRKMERLLKNEIPDPAALISTFPFSGVFECVRRLGMTVPAFTVVTDFTLHNRWLSSTPDRFFVATRDLKQAMEERGVPECRISVTGIPIRDCFYEPASPESRERFVLVMAGAFGVLRDIRSMTAQLLELDTADVTIVCGRNDGMRKELARLFAENPRVRVYGYVERVDELMRKASCMVTKAGGITLSEAIQIGVPTIVYKPFPGQEKENALYLEQEGFAAVAYRIDQLIEQASVILRRGEKNRGRAPAEAVRAEGRAADDIVARIIESIERSPILHAGAGQSVHYNRRRIE